VTGFTNKNSHSKTTRLAENTPDERPERHARIAINHNLAVCTGLGKKHASILTRGNNQPKQELGPFKPTRGGVEKNNVGEGGKIWGL